MRRDIIKVFLASPGDLVVERKAAKRIVDEENQNHAIPQGYQFDLVGWEDTVAQHGRAQAAINRDLEQCDYFVGILWKRWGTPPGPGDRPYSSGFEEEYESSEARYKATGKPDISLLFKSISDADISDAGPQLKRVLEFKDEFETGFRGVYQTFDDLQEFESRFRSILAMFLRREVEENKRIEAEERSRTLEADHEPAKGKADSNDALFDKDARDFVSELIARPTDPEKYEYTAGEAARLRLLGATLKRGENDEAVVGIHDANILYKEFRLSAIGKREIRGLLAAGLTYFNSQNVPLWIWLRRLNRAPFREVALRTLIGSDREKHNAFQVLAIIPDDLSEIEGLLDRDKLIDFWLNNFEESLLLSALHFLGRRGTVDDLPRIDKLLDVSEAAVNKSALAAKIGILLREGAEQALEFISVRDDVEVSDSNVDAIFSNPGAIRTELLRKCLDNPSINFRRRVAQELLERNELLRESGYVLVQSSDAQTRLLGARAIRSESESYSLSDARDHIVKGKKTTDSGSSGRKWDFEAEDAFEAYRHIELCAHTQIDLERMQKSEAVYSCDVTFALYDSCFSKYQSELIQNINDAFSSFLEDRLTASGLRSASEDTNEFVRQSMVQKGIELLAKKRYAQGIEAMRRAIDRGGIEYSDGLINYFRRFGVWQDIPRVIKLCENFPLHGLSLLSIVSRDKEYRLSAEALLRLGNHRVADLLSMQMPEKLWVAVIALMSKSSFSSFDNERITHWLRDETDSVRKSVSLKSVICFPKSRLEQLLCAYISDGNQYYYNVVSWLDLGVSLDRRRSIRIANSVLSEI